MRQEIKAIAFDMDGTLLNEKKQVSPETEKCFRKLEEMGIILILSTGRSYEALKPYKESLGLKHPVICYNGSQIVEDSGRIFREYALPDDISEYLVSYSRKKGIHIQSYRDSQLLFERDTPEGRKYAGLMNLEARITDFTAFRPMRFTKVMYLGSHEMLLPVKDELASVFGDRLTVMFSNPEYLEFIDGRISKGSSLKELAEHLDISVSEIMAFGDGQNDISMLETAGIGVAMGNAPEDVRKAADRTTLSNSEDGVAVFINDYFGLS